MIITRLSGGLGNQMFQYAAARALALRHGTQVAIDTSYYSPRHIRRAQLDIFPCVLNNAPRIRSWFARRQRHAGLGWMRSLPGAPYWYREHGYREHGQSEHGLGKRGVGFDELVLELPASCYLQGYFQSPRYFADCARLIREDFCFPALTDITNRRLAAQIDGRCAVAIHVRLRDYLHPRGSSSTHHALEASYYQRAMAELNNTLASPRYFLFTDDPERAARMHWESPVQLVAHNHGVDAFRDMQLMSRCTHQIIANSSFSWWAAWLNSNHAKRVIAPRNWFHPDSGHSTHDLIPADWYLL